MTWWFVLRKLDDVTIPAAVATAVEWTVEAHFWERFLE
jgi:hypothetical protein